MPTYNPFAGPQLDFTPLADIGSSIGGALSAGADQRLIKNAWVQAGGDYNKAAKALLDAGRTDLAGEVAKIGSVVSDGGMTPYQREDLRLKELALDKKPSDVQMLEWWQSQQPQQGMPEPSRVSPPQPSGVAGVSLQNAPGVIQEKFLPIQEQKRLEAAGKGQGERDSQEATLHQIAPGFQRIIDQLIVNAQEADNDTFENALGPLQGAGEPESWQGAVGQFFPQTAGAVANYLDKGMKEGFVDWKTGNIKSPGELSGGYTSTLRAKINATSASLINVLQRALRVPGIGQQSDYELRQIIAQVGELNKSRTKADFYDRLSNVVSNFNNLGIPVQMPSTDELAGVKPTSAAVQNYIQPPTQEAGAPPYDAAEEAPPMQGSVVDTGNGIPGRGAPPIPATGDKNKLIYLMHNAPPEVVKQKMEEFDKLYNWPGLASIILGQSRAGR